MAYSTFNQNDIDLIIDDLDTNLYMYRNVINQVDKYDDDKEYVQKLQDGFINNVKLFKHLMPEEPEQHEKQVLDTIKP